MHITLGLDPKGDRWHLSALPTIAVCGGTAHMGAGGTPLFSYVFFTSSEKWLTPIIARIGEYTQAEAYLQDGLDLAFTGGLHPGAYGFWSPRRCACRPGFRSQRAGRLPHGCRCGLRGGADLLLVAGDGYGGRATFFDGGVVETAGRSGGSCCTLSYALLQHSR